MRKVFGDNFLIDLVRLAKIENREPHPTQGDLFIRTY